MAQLDEVVHQPIRLRLMASLVALKGDNSVDFTYLRDLLGLTDGNLGGHLHRLEEAGYIQVSKTFVDRKPRTYIAATTKGREVFRNHVAALEEILRSSPGPKNKK